jgi:hypothetical protein
MMNLNPNKINPENSKATTSINLLQIECGSDHVILKAQGHQQLNQTKHFQIRFAKKGI